MTSHFTNPIHLYRSLLRETTYLFDPFARSYIHKYVIESFRAKSTKIEGSSTKGQSYDVTSLPTLEERRQLKRGRKLLSTLHRANQGFQTPLSNVLRLAYGRKGRRRRELMAAIMTKDTAEDTKVRHMLLEAMRGKDLSRPLNKSGELWAPPANFYALLRSQMKVQSTIDTHRKLRLKPEIPEMNKKGLPMPKSRVKNKTREWYTRIASALFPYLGEKDWNILRDRTRGKGFVFAKRRPVATVQVFGTEDGVLRQDFSHMLTGSIKPVSRRARITLGKPHKLKVRFLKRIYTRVVLRSTPKAVAATGKDVGLKMCWDYGEQKLLTAKTLPPGEQAQLLFS